MKKAIVLCLALIVSLFAVTGSIAYFTDNIQVQNRAASGNLHILQHEYERAKDGAGNVILRDYTQNQAFYPAVQATGLDKTLKIGEKTYTINGKSMNGFVDKIVVAENGGTLDAYVRTFVAVPSSFANAIHLDKNTTDWTWCSDTDIIKNQMINGTSYDICYATCTTLLEPGDKAAPSLLGFYLDSQVNHNGTNYTLNSENLGTQSELKILVATQAAQAIPNGIGDSPRMGAAESLNLTYGNNVPNADNHPWADTKIVTADKNTLKEELNKATYNTQIGLANGEYTLPDDLPDGIRIFAMGDDVRITNATIRAIDVEFDSVIFTKDVNFNGWGAFEDCIFNGNCTATASTTGNVLFSKCTFNGTKPSGDQIVILPANP